MNSRKLILPLIIVISVLAGGYSLWLWRGGNDLPEGLLKTNGRIEAEQVEVATKASGRIAEILAKEGDMVAAGALLARMDDVALQAQMRGAKALVEQARQSRAAAKAALARALSERTLAVQEFDRARELHEKGHISTALFDQRRAQRDSAAAAHSAAAAAFDQAAAAVDVARANVAELQSRLDDTLLTAPRGGRVQYKLAQAGEVVGAGARILTLLDVTDVYMTVFIPARAAGRLAIGSPARLILDPVPQYVIPARVTFVAAEAQFTPKSVETVEERDNLMFRVKLTIAPELLKQHEQKVKTGVRGTVHIAVDPDVEWPDALEVKLP